MELIFLREEILPGDEKYRRVFFVDSETNDIHIFWQVEPGVPQSGIWWFHKCESADYTTDKWMPADDLGNDMMDSLINDKTPFKE